MSKVHDGISAELQAFLERQPMFFVATAPLAPDGHVNVSPKGLDGTFVVLREHRVAYLDLTGSGIETVAHVRENAPHHVDVLRVRRTGAASCASRGEAQSSRATSRASWSSQHHSRCSPAHGR